MKVLLDPVYSTYPSRCSTAAKCAKFVDRVLNVENRNDVFFYWLVPKWITAEDWFWLPKHQNIKYVTVDYSKDRMREYAKFGPDLDSVYAFNGEYWDFDVVITSRTSMIPMMRSVMQSPRIEKHGRHLKAVVDIEEMFMLEFKTTVALSDTEVQEQMTLQGYLASDEVLLQTQSERKEIMEAARRYLSPAQQRKILDRLRFVSPVMFTNDDFKLKDPQYRFKKGDRPFNLTFTGRLEAAADLDKVYGVMDNQWIMKGDEKIKLTVCTVTPGEGDMFDPPDQIEFKHPKREEFWKLIREEIDLILSLHPSSEFSLTRIEPMILGVPVVLPKREWVTGLFGKEYPFIAGNLAEAHAWVTKFYNDYDGMYAVWEKWWTEQFVPMFLPGGPYGRSMYDHLYKFLCDFEMNQMEYVREHLTAKAKGAMVSDMLAELGDSTQFTLFKLLKAKRFGKLKEKTEPGDRDRRRITFSTDWNEARLVMKAFYGWKDALEVGGMKKC